MLSPQPRPIADFTTEEVERIVLRAILERNLTPGHYYDKESGQALTIVADSTFNLEISYTIIYKNGPYRFIFLTDSITAERRATA